MIHDLNRIVLILLPAPAPRERRALPAAQFEGIFVHPLVNRVLSRVRFESVHQRQAA